MHINLDQIVSISEANQNFSKVARKADSVGSVVIFKNNKPKYILLDISEDSKTRLSDQDQGDLADAVILDKHRKAFVELVK